MKKRYVAPAVRAEPHLRKRLREPGMAAAYLNEAAKDNDLGVFLYALREVAEAHGGITRIARKAGLNRQQLYKTLSRAGNPEMRTLAAILDVARLGISVRPYKKRSTNASRRTASARRGVEQVSPRE